MKYTLRQLEVFLAVAHHDNLTRAADSLAMSQSAASGALKDLEQQFDVRLFDRVGKRLQINDFGRAVRPRAEALLERARELELELNRHQAVGELKIGATLTIGNYLAVELIERYLRDQPGVRIDLEVANTEAIAARVSNFDLDIGLIEGEIQSPELDILPWREDELVLFCAPGHPLTKLDRLDDTDLVAATWILRERGSGTRQTFDRAMQGLLPDLNVLLELEHTHTIRQAVSRGLGIGCLSRVALAEDFERGNLIPLTVIERNFRRHFYLIMNRHKYRSAGLARWIDLCLQSG